MTQGKQNWQKQLWKSGGCNRNRGLSLEVELGNAEKVKAKAYGVAIKIEQVDAPSISIIFKGAQTVIGVETLESIGLRLHPTTGKLELTRPNGMAYFYFCMSSHWR